MKYAQFENLFYQVFRPHAHYMHINTGSVDYGEDWVRDVYETMLFHIDEKIAKKGKEMDYIYSMKNHLVEVEEDENGDWVEA